MEFGRLGLADAVESTGEQSETGEQERREADAVENHCADIEADIARVMDCGQLHRGAYEAHKREDSDE